MANGFVEFLVSFGKTVWNLFRLAGTTRRGSVELWVVLTTVLLLANFTVGSYGGRVFPRWFMKAASQFFVILNSSSVPYTIGLMEPSIKEGGGGGTLSNFFQVWAVLIVTMQYSISVGRPSNTTGLAGKDLTLVDLLSSLWSANLLRRSSTELKIRLPLWLIWSLNALRIVRYYLDSIRAADATANNMKLVSDYMASERHTAPDACPNTMLGYRYLVHGEEEHEEEILRPKNDATATGETDSVPPPKDLKDLKDLITLETVWNRPDKDDMLLGKYSDDQYKDVCLSFALYKLLRRRFYDFPMPEAANPLSRKLFFEGILKKGRSNYERAFRVTQVEVELSFLRDFSYRKHAVVFAGGFPVVRVLLPFLMVASLLYTVYAIRDIPSAGTYATADDQLARVTHGVGVTRCIIAIIACRELWEIRIYVWSQWTKFLIICQYIRLLPLRPVEGEARVQVSQGWITKLHRLMMGKAARFMFRHVGRATWDQKISQYNLISRSVVWWDTRKTRLHVRWLRCYASLGSYLENAFSHNEDGRIRIRIERLLGDLKGETHKVLVWHVATGLCQIRLLEAESEATQTLEAESEPTQQPNNNKTTPTRQPKSVYRKPSTRLVGGKPEMRPRRRHYITAVSLSNYCAYLVRQALVPDNGLVAKKVFDAVQKEARRGLHGLDEPGKVYHKLVEEEAKKPDLPTDPSVLKLGAQLSEELLSTHKDREKALWEKLAKFWAGYLLYLSANTTAAKHRVHLQGGGGELTTHLWALLSHAGFLGDAAHGHQMLDPEDLGDA
ncbi:hypothetical protein VPH35_072227 [Triticum aestivum]